MRGERRLGLLLPLGVYLAITLVVPALNGALAQPDFAGHAAWTAGTATVFVLLVVLVRLWLHSGKLFLR